MDSIVAIVYGLIGTVSIIFTIYLIQTMIKLNKALDIWLANNGKK